MRLHNNHKKIFIISFITYSVMMLIPIFCYWYGTVFLGSGLFNKEQISIVYLMASIWVTTTVLIILMAPILFGWV